MASIPVVNVGAATSDAPASNFSSYLLPIDKYRLEWNDLSTVCEDPRLLRLRQIACDGHLKVAKFRSVCWSVLLDVLRGDQHDWLQQRRVHRAMYQHIKSKWNTNPHTATETTATAAAAEESRTDNMDDPLSQSQQSVWNQHFCDQELFAVIRQDVVRTFPGVDFYRRASVQELMVDILFCYAREHPSMCYRQGMHEILAPVLFVMHCDQQTLLHIGDVVRDQRQQESDGVGDVVLEILDSRFMEEDAYFMFMKIMASIETFYHIRDMKPTPSGHFPHAQPSSSGDKRSKLEVVGQLNYIRDKILAYVDPQLHKHLLSLDIPLTLFGIRWLRLLFGREFSLQELLVLWDAIFAYGSMFALTNYVVVAMLVQIRQLLLNGDYTTCLTHLMKYPGNIDISLVIRYAMHIKSPQTHGCPPGAFPPQFATKREPQPQRPVPPVAVQRAPVVVNHRRAASHDDATAGVRSIKPSTATNSTTTTATDEQLRAHMQAIQKSAAAVHLKTYTGEPDSSIVEGFRVNSPEALRIELESARAVMSFTRFKLIQYLGVLRQHRPNGNAVDSINQALDGIEELCSMLQTKPSPDYARALPVECAFEAANEPAVPERAAQKSSTLPSQKAPTKKPLPSTKSHPHTDESTRRAFVQQLCNDEFEVFVHPDNGGLIDSLACGDSLQQLQQQRRLSGSNPRYEIPDDDRSMSRKVTKILGDRREVEMHEFRSGQVAECIVSSTVDEDPPGERE